MEKVNYNVKVYFNNENITRKEAIRFFNQKLLNVILSLETKKDFCQE